MNGSGMGGSDYQIGFNVGVNVQLQVRYIDVFQYYYFFGLIWLMNY